MISLSTLGKKVWTEIQEDRSLEGAAALAYYLTLATFPALIAVVAAVPFLPLEGVRETFVGLIQNNLPGAAGELITQIIRETLSNQDVGILSTSFIGALWASSSGMGAIINQLNIAYDVEETRGIFKQRLMAIALTFLYLFMTILASAIIVLSESYTPQLTSWMSMIPASDWFITIGQYLIAAAVVLLAFASVYFIAPNSNQKFEYITPGSIVGTILLILGAIAFDYYASNFASYDKTYGSIGGIIIYMLWLYIAGFVLILGAEINQVIGDMKRGQATRSGPTA